MISGTLFISDFLIEGIKDTEFWRSLDDDAFASFKQNLLNIYETFPIDGNPNESQTERDLIDKIIEILGWEDYLTQQTTSQKGRKDVPDYLLFVDANCKSKANKETKQSNRYKHGLAILEAKAWLIHLDRKGSAANGDGVPSNQILRYLNRADIQSDGSIKWGILTNGREWRLYYQDAKSRSEEFLSLDLPLILELKGFQDDLFSQTEREKQDWLKVFYAIFCKNAFIKFGPDNLSFHQRALEEGRYWEDKVASDLSEVVFNEVLPGLARQLMDNDPDKPAALNDEYLSELRDATLVLLYRLLFILYAEDRNLLPANDLKYDDYGLKKRVRDDIRKRIDGNDVFSDTLSHYYNHVTDLCRAIDQGDTSIGLPPYNGGLFDPSKAPILTRSKIPDAAFAPIFDKLSRRYEGEERLWINYRDLSVQQLGSIYERFLEYELSEEGGEIVVRPNIFSRKTTGSYYTPDSLVNLIIEKAVGPLIDDKLDEFLNKATELKSKKGPKSERIKQLIKYDPASRILEMRICDPAMGSGHFLVSLVDYLADILLILIEEADSIVDWADDKRPYVNPLIESIQEIRTHILEEARKHNWVVSEDQLDDRHIIRRMILKRCVYGVDKNPMAVELAKVSLWLHTFTVGAPLSFLDHHLRCGDSLFGEFTYDVEEQLRKEGNVFITSEVNKAKATAKGMAVIEQLTDSDIAEVKESATVFNDVTKATNPLARFFDFIHAVRWMDTSNREKRNLIHTFLVQAYGDPIHLCEDESILTAQPARPEQATLLEEGHAQEEPPTPVTISGDTRRALLNILREARLIVEEEGFFHWEIAFPMVWDNWESPEPDDGFDAVIGNPPWDRIKLQEVEWFSMRKPEIAHAARASDRKRMIKELEDANDPLWQAYQKASQRAKASADVARSIGHYPLLSSGDINLYSLFVERAHRLVKSEGIVGLLTPSGIASDKSASKFFKIIATESHLANFYDFENKKIFFPDIDSRFKFSVYVAGGRKRKFDKANMSFFLHSVDELGDDERKFALTADDFARVNPNTGTAPIFRTRRDADITRKIYEKYPILSSHEQGKVWPVKYFTMFHMTNDSNLFKTRVELEADGFYAVEGNRLKKSEDEYLPLYEGKMVQAFDHRAASVVINLDNLNRPSQPKIAKLEEHQNPKWMPSSQYWVDKDEVRLPINLGWYVAFKEITASTNMRTMIASVIPRYAANNKLPILIPSSDKCIPDYSAWGPLLCANLNAFAFDFVVRQKTHSNTLNWYIVEQFPLIPPSAFDGKIGKTKIADLIRDHVLRLTYTAKDMEPFARDMGYKGKPFIWDEEERRHLRARLDALFFNLYDISHEDAEYILSTFPIVKKNDEKEFGRYITRDLILGYMNALDAGDTKSTISV